MRQRDTGYHMQGQTDLMFEIVMHTEIMKNSVFENLIPLQNLWLYDYFVLKSAYKKEFL